MYCHNSVNFHFHISVCEWAGQNFVTFTRVKLCRRPEVNSEPAHFLTFMKNGVAFPSLGWHAAYQCPDQFQLKEFHDMHYITFLLLKTSWELESFKVWKRKYQSLSQFFSMIFFFTLLIFYESAYVNLTKICFF